MNDDANSEAVGEPAPTPREPSFAPAADIFEALESIPGIHNVQTNQPAGPGPAPEPSRSADEAEAEDAPAVVVIFDIDGVIAPIRGPTGCGDDVVVGDPSHELHLSPSMCAAIDRLDGSHGVGCYWLSDWTPKMRYNTTSLPGREWPAIAEPPHGVTRAEEWAGEWWHAVPWWKWWALDEWLTHHQGVRRLVWIDADLSDYKHNAEDTRTARRGATSPAQGAWTIENALRTGAGLDILLLSPDKHTGLRPLDLETIEYWVLGVH